MSATDKPPLIFLFSHPESNDVLSALNVHLAPLVHQGVLDVWHPAQITPGRTIKAETEAALLRARTAVLLVSPELLVHDEVDVGVATLLARRTPLFCLYVAPCMADFKQYCCTITGSTQPVAFKLTDVKGLNDPGKPLKCLNAKEQQEVLVGAARDLGLAVAGALTRPIEMDGVAVSVEPCGHSTLQMNTSDLRRWIERRFTFEDIDMFVAEAFPRIAGGISSIVAPGYDFKYRIFKLVQYFERRGRTLELQRKVEEYANRNE